MSTALSQPSRSFHIVYYCWWTTATGLSRTRAFSTLPQAREQARVLADLGMHGTIERRQEPENPTGPTNASIIQVLDLSHFAAEWSAVAAPKSEKPWRWIVRVGWSL